MTLFKTCSKCKKELPISEFWKNKASNDGYQGYCKSCGNEVRREYQKQNPSKAREYAKKHYRKYKEEKIKGDRVRVCNRQKFLDTLKTPCVKCGEKRPWVIQFHHRDNSAKSFCVSDSAKYHKSKDDIIKEAEKCVCLCANCHKEFHYLYGMKPEKPIEALDEYLKTRRIIQ